VKAAKNSQDGELPQAPWRTLISSVHPNPTVKINYGATFMVTDQSCAVPLEAGERGLYSADTRFVSRHELRLNGRRPESVASVRLSYRHSALAPHRRRCRRRGG